MQRVIQSRESELELNHVGTKLNYHLSTSILITSVLPYMALEDGIKNRKQSSKLMEAETQG